jgi:hypothetical protein
MYPVEVRIRKKIPESIKWELIVCVLENSNERSDFK